MYVKYLQSYRNIQKELFDNSGNNASAYANSANTVFGDLLSKDTIKPLEEPKLSESINNLNSNINNTELKESQNTLASASINSNEIKARYFENQISNDWPSLSAPKLERLTPANLEPSVKNLQPSTTNKADSLPIPFVVEANKITTKNASRADIKAFVTNLVDSAAKKFQLDTDLGLAIIETESSFNWGAISKDGHNSKGLFQLLDSTGKELLNKSNLNRDYDPFDPHLNVELGMRHLRKLFDIFSTETKLTNSLSTVAVDKPKDREKFAIAAFNAGEGRVAWAQHKVNRMGGNPQEFQEVENLLPTSTKRYVAKVLNNKNPG